MKIGFTYSEDKHSIMSLRVVFLRWSLKARFGLHPLLTECAVDQVGKVTYTRQ